MINLLRKLGRVACVMAASTFPSAALSAQSGEVSLRGQVTDQSGAVVPGITVTIDGPSGATREVQTDGSDGRYVFRDLPPGMYTLRIQVKGFADFEKTGVVIVRGQPQVINPQLVVATEKQEITVKEEKSKVSVSPTNNASSLVLRGANDLAALSDDPTDLEADLQALAGQCCFSNLAFQRQRFEC